MGVLKVKDASGAWVPIGLGIPDVTAWTAPTLIGGWANYGGGNQVAQYRKVGDMVQIRGVIKDGSLSAAAFILPIGFRPPLAGNLAMHLAGGGATYCDISVFGDGSVIPIVGPTTLMWMNCQFSTAL